MVLCILSKVAIEFCLCVWSYLDFMVLCMLFDLDFILWFMYYISTLINEFCIEFWCICRCGQIWTSVWVKGLDKKCVVRGVVSEVLFLSFDIFLFLFFCFFFNMSYLNCNFWLLHLSFVIIKLSKPLITLCSKTIFAR